MGGRLAYELLLPLPQSQAPRRPQGEHLADRLAAESIKFLEHAGNKPFLLYHAFYSVHIPLQAKRDLIAKYEAKRKGIKSEGPLFKPEGDRQERQYQDHAVYAAMVESLDQNVGRILDALDRLGLAGNTIVFFMSDNGGLSTAEGAPTCNLPLRAGKGWLYEGGIREPMIVKWPGVTKPGSTSSTPVVSTDFYPTILEMAGLPAIPWQHVDGLSLLPVLKQTGSTAFRALYWHYPHYGNQGGSPSGAIRLGDWKLIEFFEDGRRELYDLKDDLGEQHNLAAAQPEKAAALYEKLKAWRLAVAARMPSPNPNGKIGDRRTAGILALTADD